MLSTFEIVVALALTVGDVLIVRAYVGPREDREGKCYPKRSFVLHVLGGLGALALGALALLAYGIGLTALADVAAIGQGLAVVLFAGLFALPMSRYTAGYSGFNLVGYVLYTLAWIASAAWLAWEPGPQAAYACFVLTHAYLTCRVMVWAVEVGWQRWRGQAPQPEPAYSIATTIAALIPLALAWGWLGVVWHLSSITVAIALQRAGISSPWHASHVDQAHVSTS